MPGRQTVAQQQPAPDRDYRRFPHRVLEAGPRWYRQHDAALHPWWFSSSMAGRFDLPAPHGTCYLASTRAAAVRERIGPDLAASGQVPTSVVAGRGISVLTLADTVRSANLESDRATHRYGVTGELAVMTPYEVPQAWARTLHEAGLDGIVTRLRFTVSRRHEGLALFGAAGEHRQRPVESGPEPLPGLARDLGITIVDPPDDDQVTVITP